MALSRKEMRVEVRKLYNLTEEFLFVYAYDGQILILTPDIPPKEWAAGEYWIVDGNLSCGLSIPASHLIRPKRGGIGRDGDPMTTLVLLSDPSFRVYPMP